MVKITVFIDDSSTITPEPYQGAPHWACGKVNCDCDDQTDQAMDEDSRRAEEDCE